MAASTLNGIAGSALLEDGELIADDDDNGEMDASESDGAEDSVIQDRPEEPNEAPPSSPLSYQSRDLPTPSSGRPEGSKFLFDCPTHPMHLTFMPPTTLVDGKRHESELDKAVGCR